MNRHKENWQRAHHFTLIRINYGSYRTYDMEEAMNDARGLHQRLMACFPYIDGGVYHVQLVWDETYRRYTILYHYLLNAHRNYAFYIALALNGQALLEWCGSFENYDRAAQYFVRQCCSYPADILLDFTKVYEYLGLLKRRRLIQGFGDFYRCSGGLNKEHQLKKRPQCPICHGDLHYVGRTTRQYCYWDNDISCYRVDPGAPGLHFK